MKYWCTQFRDACLLVVVPAVAAVLPWSLGWRWLRYWSRKPWGAFADAANVALPIARQWLQIEDDTVFAERMRLLWLMDGCDLYASMLRPRRTRPPRYVEQLGQWPKKSGFIALGFHYGVGHEVLRNLAAANYDYTFVSGRWRREDYPGLPVRYWYGRLRARDIARIGGRPIAYRPGIKQTIDQTLREAAVVVGLIDLPPRLAPRQRHEVTLLGRKLSLPAGMIELAREAGVPVVPYWIEFDDDMYRRRVRIGDPIEPDDSAAALAKVAEILDERIRAAPYAWMLWPELPGWAAEEVSASDAGDGGSADQAL